MSRTLTLLGSTGSIGTQALEVIAAHPHQFRVHALAAGGSDPELLAEQAVRTGAARVALARSDEQTLERLQRALEESATQQGRPAAPVEILTGQDGVVEVAGDGADVVLNGITGSIGLRPTLAALAAGSTLALANKESLIVGGTLVTGAARTGQIVPVDSEHSAIAQALRAGRAEEVRRLVLTASGGPFRGRSRAEMAQVTPAEALRHPNFSMGTVVTTNSATMVNKGLEVIEAHHLFDIPLQRIEVVVHPQQQIHSMVEFHDGSTIAQAGPPRMLVPIALGLSWPGRLPDVDAPCDWTQAATWQFEPLDEDAFPAVRLARRAGQTGGTFPAVYNAANEECVAAFHQGSLPFLAITDVIAQVLDDHATTTGDPVRRDGSELDVAAVLAADAWARRRAQQILSNTP